MNYRAYLIDDWSCLLKFCQRIENTSTKSTQKKSGYVTLYTRIYWLKVNVYEDLGKVVTSLYQIHLHACYIEG